MKVVNQGNPGNKRVLRGVVFVCTVFAFLFFLNQSIHADVVFFEDFEGSGVNDWHASHGTWEVGTPTSGPESAYSGDQCAATILDGDYVETVDSRLIRNASFIVPPTSENPRLRFQHWYSFGSRDYGIVQIKDSGNDTWIDISDKYENSSGGVWTRPYIPLSSYAGMEVEIAFYFHSQTGTSANIGDINVSSGWYIDDVTVTGGESVTTTTTIQCPSEALYGNHADQTELLRHFRDNVLTQTPAGQELIKLYYQWSPAIVQAMEDDKEFKEEVHELVDGVLLLIGE